MNTNYFKFCLILLTTVKEFLLLCSEEIMDSDFLVCLFVVFFNQVLVRAKHKTSLDMFPHLYFPTEFVQNWYYFFVKYFVENTSEIICIWNFFYGRVLGDPLNLSNRNIKLLTFSISALSVLNSCVFWGICLFYIGCQIYWPKLFIIFLYFLFNVQWTYRDDFSFITCNGNLCFYFYFSLLNQYC